MSYTEFIPKTFSDKHLAIIHKADEIMGRYSDGGYDLSLRQLYYQFIAHYSYLFPHNGPDGSPNTEQNYKMLGGIISDARLAGMLEWDTLVDRGRTTIENPHWGTPADIVESAALSYRINMWEDQRFHVEVMVEKQALEGVLVPVCRNLDLPFTANKGYSSSSAMYQAGKRLEAKLDEGKQVIVLYLGDHDPSGLDMSRDVTDRLALFSGAGYWYAPDKKVEIYSDFYDRFSVRRVALNMGQIEEYNPPPNPTKMTDSRAGGYMRQYGDECWELDALDPEVLARLVQEEVVQYIDHDLWSASEARWKTERGLLLDMATAYRKGQDN